MIIVKDKGGQQFVPGVEFNPKGQLVHLENVSFIQKQWGKIHKSQQYDTEVLNEGNWIRINMD